MTINKEDIKNKLDKLYEELKQATNKDDEIFIRGRIENYKKMYKKLADKQI